MKVPHEVAFARWPHTKNVEDRLRRLNPGGFEEGEIPRGWYPHRRSFCPEIDALNPKAFIARYGRAAYRALPREAFNRDGHRKAVKWRYCIGRNGEA